MEDAEALMKAGKCKGACCSFALFSDGHYCNLSFAHALALSFWRMFVVMCTVLTAAADLTYSMQWSEPRSSVQQVIEDQGACSNEHAVSMLVQCTDTAATIPLQWRRASTSMWP